MKRKKYLYTTIVIIILVLFSYWAKSKLGINFSDSFSISKYFPFKYLTRSNVIKASVTGELINEPFESKLLPNNWSKLWMKEKGKVTQGYDKNGINNSRTLLIKSNSSKSWSYSHNMFIQVEPGDNFRFEGLVKTNGKAVTAFLGVASFDMNKKVIKWSHVRKKVDKTNLWVNVKEHFKISSNEIEYIRLRLTGYGIGEFWFDEIKLMKE